MIINIIENHPYAIYLNDGKSFLVDIDGEIITEINSDKYEDKLISIDPKTKFITDKMPHNVLHAGFIAQLFPASKLIYCRRIDNDVMMSCFRRNFHGSHEYATSLDSIRHYMSKVHAIMEHWKRVLPLPIFELIYEDFPNNDFSFEQKIISYKTNLDPLQSRFIRVKGYNIHQCPDYHPGAGGPAWIFSDEIIIN